MSNPLIERRKTGPSTANFLTLSNYRYLRLFTLSTIMLTASYGVYSDVSVPRGGTVPGLLYGVGALIAILVLLMLGVRRRRYSSSWGTVQGWLSSHIYLGLLTMVLVPFHAGFNFGANIHTMAFLIMTAVVISGMVGVYLYRTVPQHFHSHGRELHDAELDARLHDLQLRMQALADNRYSTAFSDLISTMRRAKRGTIPRRFERAQVAIEEQQAYSQLLALATQKIQLEQQTLAQFRTRRLLEGWLYVHVPLSLALLVAVFVHIAVVLYYR